MAGKYRRVMARFWSDSRVRALSENGKLMFLFLLTGPGQTSIGAMPITMAALTERFSFKPEPVLAELADMIKIDEKAGLIVLVNYIKHNEPQNHNQVVHFAQALDLLPECELLDWYVGHVGAYVRAHCKQEIVSALPAQFRTEHKVPDPSPKQEPPISEPADTDEWSPGQCVVYLAERWNEMAKRPTCTGERLPSVTDPAAYEDRVRARLNDRKDRSWWDYIDDVIDAIPEEAFLCGAGSEGFKANFNFLLKKGKALMIKEGNYRGKAKGNKKKPIGSSVSRGDELF